MEANCPQIGQQSKKATGEEDGEANAGASQGHPAQSTRVRGQPSAPQGLAMASCMLSNVAVAFPIIHKNTQQVSSSRPGAPETLNLPSH